MGRNGLFGLLVVLGIGLVFGFQNCSESSLDDGLTSSSSSSDDSSSGDDSNGSIITSPTITTQPIAGATTIGQAVTMAVGASGGDLRFQWYRGGAEINNGDADPRVFFIPSFSTADVGDYSVVVSNSAGAVESNTITLAVSDNDGPPTIVSEPQAVNADPGDSSVIAVQVIGRAPMTYTWSKDGVAYASSNSNVFVMGNVDESDDGDYSVIITNELGQADSSAVRVKVYRYRSCTSRINNCNPACGGSYQPLGAKVFRGSMSVTSSSTCGQNGEGDARTCTVYTYEQKCELP